MVPVILGAVLGLLVLALVVVSVVLCMVCRGCNRSNGELMRWWIQLGKEGIEISFFFLCKCIFNKQN